MRQVTKVLMDGDILLGVKLLDMDGDPFDGKLIESESHYVVPVDSA